MAQVPATSPDEILQRGQALRRNNQGTEETAEEQARRLRSRDQSWAARVIVGFFVAFDILLILFVFTGLLTGHLQWTQASDFMLEVLKISVLPVVTFVLGYYFGSTEK